MGLGLENIQNKKLNISADGEGKSNLRSPIDVMRLERMGSFHPMRLSFSRQLLRRMAHEQWHVEITDWQINDQGHGHAVISAQTPDHVYSLVAFSHDLDDQERSDRVIAEKWDSTFTLVDGTPSPSDIAIMSDTVSKQEAGRQRPDQLTLSRANKSVRMFNHVVDRLSNGQQPDAKMVNQIGYVMRTTAVYGNGKFGIGDRAVVTKNPAMFGPFQAEMLTVFLIRHFSIALINHLAKVKGGDHAVSLDADLARHFGIGNATGLGMAPFLVHHQVLLHHWMQARETALARVLDQETIPDTAIADIKRLLARAQTYTHQWRVDDQVQSDRITQLEQDLITLNTWVSGDWGRRSFALAALMQAAMDELALEAQEMLVSILFEPFGKLIDDLGDEMAAKEQISVNTGIKTQDLKKHIEQDYDWALNCDLSDQEQSTLFWYVSEAKLEPRLGRRFEEDGADQEMPFDFAHQIQSLKNTLDASDNEMLAGFMLRHPEHRQIIRRVMNTAQYPYGEIRDNLVAATTRPIDMLRCKLSFFGASKFDPKSDLWTRITLFQGAPLVEDLSQEGSDDWLFSTLDIPAE